MDKQNNRDIVTRYGGIIVKKHNEQIRPLCFFSSSISTIEKNWPYVVKEMNEKQWLVVPNKFLHRRSIVTKKKGKRIMQVNYMVKGRHLRESNTWKSTKKHCIKGLVCVYPSGRKKAVLLKHSNFLEDEFWMEPMFRKEACFNVQFQ